jgi:hypothetical protein
MSHSWLGFISQTQIWMFNISVLYSCTPVCHSSHKLSIRGLQPKPQRKGILNFTTLKRDYHLATSWCCENNSKDSTFVSPNVLRASASNGSLVSNLIKSSKLTGKSSYYILVTGHHKCTLAHKRVKKTVELYLAMPCASIFH